MDQGKESSDKTEVPMTTTASSVHSTAQSEDAADPQVTITESRLKVLLNQAAEQAAEHVLQKMIDTSNGDRRTRMMERTRSEPSMGTQTQ